LGSLELGSKSSNRLAARIRVMAVIDPISV
jgi:hypothetical protein